MTAAFSRIVRRWARRQISGEICHRTGRPKFPFYHSINGTSSGRAWFAASRGGRSPPRLCSACLRARSAGGRSCVSWLTAAGVWDVWRVYAS